MDGAAEAETVVPSRLDQKTAVEVSVDELCEFIKCLGIYIVFTSSCWMRYMCVQHVLCVSVSVCSRKNNESCDEIAG